jgi:hypothetical protein
MVSATEMLVAGSMVDVSMNSLSCSSFGKAPGLRIESKTDFTKGGFGRADTTVSYEDVSICGEQYD